MILGALETGGFAESDAIHRFWNPMPLLLHDGFPERASLWALFRPKLNVTPFKTGSVASHDNVMP